MKGIFFGILLIFSFLSGCSPNSAKGDNRVVAQVNNYKMTAGDLKYELNNVPYDEGDALKTEKGRKRYLGNLFEKEILLQEAQRQGLDKEKAFMKSIENYWEQALLKALLERKSKEILGLMHVYDNEIDEYYRASGEDMPLSKVKNEITDIIKQKKEAEAMDTWINELKNKSYIKVDEGVVEEALSNNK
jgi:peptidyl-prolyl cis-trans isomerase C